MQPAQDPADRPRRRALWRYGPIAVVVLVIAAVVAVSVLGDDDEPDAPAAETAADPGELPEGVITWTVAQEEGLDVDWPDTCDTSTGRIAIPFFFRTECFAPVDDNGGATGAQGVTGDTITVVAWLPSENDPVWAIVRQGLGIDDTVEEVKETYEGLVEIFQTYYETYGRTVELEFVEASGAMLDPVTARADAVEAASHEPFLVLGGPLLSGTWTEELHARDIICVACPGASGTEPTAFGIVPSESQTRRHVVSYVSAKLAGKPADFAGGDLAERERVFGLLSLAQSEGDEEQAADLRDDLAEEGADVAHVSTFPLDPGRAQELAVNEIAKMKDAGVTTVIVEADPITLPAFTREATKQGWFPEWFLAGFPFTDTTTFGRTFDQEQWQRAFGLSYLPPAAPPRLNPAYQLYEWYHGTPPPADESLLLTYPQVALTFTGFEYAGPNLTVETFRDGLFAFPPTPKAVTQPSVNYGDEVWDEPEYQGIDDMVEFWWDADATGPDETGEEGTGMIRYVDGGQRYYHDEYTDELKVFEEEGSVTVITDPPPSEVPPDYPSPAGGG